jgi:hypothetical protein
MHGGGNGRIRGVIVVMEEEEAGQGNAGSGG